MSMKDTDRKKLWGRSGNICSHPSCDTELASEKRTKMVIGVEAHIKGEKPGSARYDASQSAEERDSYENRILLCPTHHTEIDSDESYWTMERLVQMKVAHEQQIHRNQLFPELVDDLAKLMQKYEPTNESVRASSDVDISSVTGNMFFRVDASNEKGFNTNVKLQAGQRVAFFARGLISYDNSGRHFTTPEGIICNEYGIPYRPQDADGNVDLIMWPHPEAYKTNGDELGRIGSLIGWVNEYTEQGAFLIGSKREIEIEEDGVLCLKVNDAKDAYGDNDGEFRVDIKIIE